MKLITPTIILGLLLILIPLRPSIGAQGKVTSGMDYIFPKDTRTIFEHCDRMTILRVHPKGMGPNTHHMFHDFFIDKQIKIESKSERAAVVKSVISAINASDGNQGECFLPGYGVAVSSGKRRLDVLICFLCGSVQTYGSGNIGAGPITSKAQPILARIAGK